MDKNAVITAIIFGVLVITGGLLAWQRAPKPDEVTPAPIEEPADQPSQPEICAKEGTEFSMIYGEAVKIATASSCVKQGTLTEDHFCNEITGTWWIDLEVADTPNCAPACVVNVETGAAEINWRCTGVVPELPQATGSSEIETNED